MNRAMILLANATLLTSCGQQGAGQPPLNVNNAVKGLPSHPPDLTGWPILDRHSRQVGNVRTQVNGRSVVISLYTTGLTPGVHGVHIHQFPKCEPPTFESAGAHWNWTHKEHGHKNPKGYHAGDLGNLTVDQDRKGQATFTVAANDWDPKLTGGLPIIIHAQADDDKTDPSGNSGERIACGVLYLRRD